MVVSLLFPGLVLAASPDSILEGAKKEGKLVLYTVMQPEDSTKLIELYRSRYPFVDATFFRAGSAPLLNRILTETRSNRFLFDVVSGKVADLLLLQMKGLLGRIIPTSWRFIRTSSRTSKTVGWIFTTTITPLLTTRVD